MPTAQHVRPPAVRGLRIMLVEPTALAGVCKITPVRHGDDRGWFSEVWNRQTWAAAGFELDFVQDNESVSVTQGTIRGIHFQTAPHAQEKVVRVLRGRVLDVAVDLRQSSPTFGHHVSIELSADIGNQLLIPKGFGHGFVTLEPDCHVAYKVSTPYVAAADVAVSPTDPTLAIDWGIAPSEATISAKDRAAPELAAAADLLFS